MVELVSSSGVLNTVKKQHKIVKEPVSCLKTLTIIGYQNQVDDCLSFISENKTNSLWFEAIDMGNQYETEDDRQAIPELKELIFQSLHPPINQ